MGNLRERSEIDERYKWRYAAASRNNTVIDYT